MAGSNGSAPTDETKNGVPEGGRGRENAEEIQAPNEIIKAKQPLEYYVHYLEDERLMDRWVKENMV